MYEKDDILAEAERLSERIKSLDTVKEYHKVESQIHHNENLEQRMKELKKNQKQSVNLQNYGKIHALQASEEKIQDIEEDINILPIVEEFRESQAEANDLLQRISNFLLHLWKGFEHYED